MRVTSVRMTEISGFLNMALKSITNDITAATNAASMSIMVPASGTMEHYSISDEMKATARYAKEIAVAAVNITRVLDSIILVLPTGWVSVKRPCLP